MSVVDAKPLAINSILLRELYPRHCERSEAIHCHLACGGMDCFAALAMTTCAYPLLLLLLLRLLAGIDHPPFGERNGFMEHRDVTDMVGEHQHQRRIEVGALRPAQAP